MYVVTCSEGEYEVKKNKITNLILRRTKKQKFVPAYLQFYYMFEITYLFNLESVPKQGTRLYFLRKHWEIFKQLFEKKKGKRNFVSLCVTVEQDSIVDEKLEPENHLPTVLRSKSKLLRGQEKEEEGSRLFFWLYV